MLRGHSNTYDSMRLLWCMRAYDKYNIQQFYVLQQFGMIWKPEFYLYRETQLNALLRIASYCISVIISIDKIKTEDNTDIIASILPHKGETIYSFIVCVT